MEGVPMQDTHDSAVKWTEKGSWGKVLEHLNWLLTQRRIQYGIFCLEEGNDMDIKKDKNRNINLIYDMPDHTLYSLKNK
jgi:hypothetical protein